jgi:hypothetical protein
MLRAPRRNVWLGFGIGVLALIALGSWLLVGSQLAQGIATPTIRIASGEAEHGANVTVRLEALAIPAPGLGSYVIDVSYDSSIVDPVGCTPDPTHVILSPYCNENFGPQVVRCGGFNTAAGLMGQVALCDITFQVVGDPGECSALSLTVDEFYATNLEPITHDVQHGQICAPPPPDGDGDGVPDADDQCPNTGAGATVDTNGCSAAQVDADGDGICNPAKTSSWCTGSDNCPSTPKGATVDANGCSAAQVDADGDGVCDPAKTSSLCTGSDTCANTPPGERPVDAKGCSQHQVDQDMDDVCDPGKSSSLCSGSDNCPSTPNEDQADLDGDGKGDVCDSDMDGDAFSNSDEEYYGSDPRDKASTPESLAIAGTCTDGKDNDGDGDIDAGELDGPDGDSAPDCAAVPPPPPTPTPSPTATATPTPTATPGVLPLVSIPMAAGWNDKCYAGEEMAIEDALSGIEDKVLAIYMLNESGAFEGWFPGNPDASTIETLHPYDQLFVLLSGTGSWKQEQSAETRASVNLVQGWNSICYSGETKPVEEATAGIADAIAILYKFSDTQAWDLYVPGGVGNITTLTKLDSVLVLVTAEGGIIWVFDS